MNPSEPQTDEVEAKRSRALQDARRTLARQLKAQFTRRLRRIKKVVAILPERSQPQEPETLLKPRLKQYFFDPRHLDAAVITDKFAQSIEFFDRHRPNDFTVITDIFHIFITDNQSYALPMQLLLNNGFRDTCCRRGTSINQLMHDP